MDNKYSRNLLHQEHYHKEDSSKLTNDLRHSKDAASKYQSNGNQLANTFSRSKSREKFSNIQRFYHTSTIKNQLKEKNGLNSFNNTTSIKNLKQIRYKLEQTNCISSKGKQNNKQNITNTSTWKTSKINSQIKRQQLLNSRSQCALKRKTQLPTITNNLTQTEPNKLNQSSSKYFTKSKSKLNFKTQADEDTICYQSLIYNSLSTISHQQEGLLEQKTKLQYRLNALREAIEKEKTFISQINKNINIMNKSIIKGQHSHKNNDQQSKVSQKKLQNLTSQTKVLQQYLNLTLSEKIKIKDKIEEQNYLITTYTSVIEQLKCQLKIELTQKNQLHKNISCLKKTQSNLLLKLNSQQTTTREIFRKVYSSLQKCK